MEIVIAFWVLGLTTLQLLRIAAEELIALVLGRESPRLARRKRRQELAQEHLAATGELPLLNTASSWLANRIKNPPKRRAMREFRTWLDEVLADGFEDALTGHQIRRHRRHVKRDIKQAEWERQQEAEQERAEQERRAAAAEQENPDAGPDDAMVVFRQCAGGCPQFVREPRVRCDEDEGQCPGGAGQATPVEGDTEASGAEGDTAPSATSSSEWAEVTAGARPEPGDDRRPGQAGEALHRQWEQPHPRGFGTLLITRTAWVHDDGQRRRMVTEIAWQWLGPDGRALFEHRDRADSSSTGPSGEAWPAEDDVRRALDDARPTAAVDTPLLPILDAEPCPGTCGTWTVGGICPECAQPSALPDDTPAPDPTPDTSMRKADAMNLPARRSDTAAPARRGDTTDPLTVLAYAQHNVDTNARCQQQLELMMRKLVAFGVGDDTVRLVADVYRPGEAFGSAGQVAIKTAARHVATKADLQGNPALRDTVRNTYLSATRAGTLVIPRSTTTIDGDVRRPDQAAKAMKAVMDIRITMIGGLAQKQDTLRAEGVDGDLIAMITAQREAAFQSASAAKAAADEFVRQMIAIQRFRDANPDMVRVVDGEWMALPGR